MAAILNAKQLVEFVKKAVADEWGYVWGGQGQLYTKELAEKWGKAQRSGKSYNYYVVDCARWIGHIIVDCSGLIVEAFRSVQPSYADRSSTTLYNQCVEKGAIKSIPDVPGLCVWRQGHIGVYIGGGQVIEAGGYKHGVKITPLTSPATGKAWTNWGKLKDVDYTLLPGLPDAGEGEEDIMIKKGDKNANVKAWQQALLEVGEQLPKYGVDGSFGSETEAATKSFQGKNKLPQTGIVDAVTAATMFNVLMSRISEQKTVSAQKIAELEGIVKERNERLKTARKDIYAVADRLIDGI